MPSSRPTTPSSPTAPFSPSRHSYSISRSRLGVTSTGIPWNTSVPDLARHLQQQQQQQQFQQQYQEEEEERQQQYFEQQQQSKSKSTKSRPVSVRSGISGKFGFGKKRTGSTTAHSIYGGSEDAAHSRRGGGWRHSSDGTAAASFLSRSTSIYDDCISYVGSEAAAPPTPMPMPTPGSGGFNPDASIVPTGRTSSLGVSVPPSGRASRLSLSLGLGAQQLTKRAATCYEKAGTIESALQAAVETMGRLTVDGVKVPELKLKRRVSLPNLFKKQPPSTLHKVSRNPFRDARGYCFLTLSKKGSSHAVLFCKLDNETLSSPLFMSAQFPEDFLQNRRGSLFASSSSAGAASGGNVEKCSSGGDPPSHLLLIFKEANTIDLFRKPTSIIHSPLFAVHGPIGAEQPTFEMAAAPVYTYAFNAKSNLLYQGKIDIRGVIFKQAPELNESFYRIASIKPSDILDAHYHTPVAARELRQALQKAMKGVSQGTSLERKLDSSAVFQLPKKDQKAKVAQRMSRSFSDAPPVPDVPSTYQSQEFWPSPLSIVSSFASSAGSRTLTDGRGSSIASSHQSSEASTPPGSLRSSTPPSSALGIEDPSLQDPAFVKQSTVTIPEHHHQLKVDFPLNFSRPTGYRPQWSAPSPTLPSSTIAEARRESQASMYSEASGLSRVSEECSDESTASHEAARFLANQAEHAFGAITSVAHNLEMQLDINRLLENFQSKRFSTDEGRPTSPLPPVLPRKSVLREKLPLLPGSPSASLRSSVQLVRRPGSIYAYI